MRLVKNKYFPLTVIFLATLIFYLPIFTNPSLFINRNNDLQEFFWPIYYFVKNQILTNQTVPLWNNLILSGTPLLFDPQAPFFYLPDLIFLILPINSGFVISIFLHTFWGGFGIYLISKLILKINKTAAILTAVFFVFSPKLAAYVEAGNFGLILNWSWLPWLLLSTLLISIKPQLRWSFLLAISSASLFHSHPPTFIYAATLSFLIFLSLLLINREDRIKSIFFYLLGGVASFGLSAIALLPLIPWISQTNRYLQIQNPQVWPIWNGKIEFIRQILMPQNIESEKWIPLGIVTLILALWGFIKIKNSYKVIISILTLIILIISANNLTPFYTILIAQKWFDYLRVATRIWFVPTFLTIFLAGLAYQNKIKAVFYLALVELLFLSWIRFNKPMPNPIYAPQEVYEFLAKDKDLFRVYCTTRCLSQKKTAIYNLELVDGYSTLIQKNYNSVALQLTGAYWDYYTLSIPPIGSFSEKLKPNISSLGKYNTKYVISPYVVDDENLTQVNEIDKYYIYLNKVFKPRSPAPIVLYQPNKIVIDTSHYSQKSIVISEVFSKDWNAYTDKDQKVEIKETPISLRSIDIPTGTNTLTLKYEPESYKIGKTISLVTILLTISGLIFYLTYQRICCHEKK